MIPYLFEGLFARKTDQIIQSLYSVKKSVCSRGKQLWCTFVQINLAENCWRLEYQFSWNGHEKCICTASPTALTGVRNGHNLPEQFAQGQNRSCSLHSYFSRTVVSLKPLSCWRDKAKKSYYERKRTIQAFPFPKIVQTSIVRVSSSALCPIVTSLYLLQTNM